MGDCNGYSAKSRYRTGTVRATFAGRYASSSAWNFCGVVTRPSATGSGCCTRAAPSGRRATRATRGGAVVVCCRRRGDCQHRRRRPAPTVPDTLAGPALADLGPALAAALTDDPSSNLAFHISSHPTAAQQARDPQV